MSRWLEGRRIPGLPDYWENYFLCMLLHMLLPLLPLGLEFWQKATVGEKSLTLAAAMYTIAVGVSSRSRLIFGLTVSASIIYAVAYGVSSAEETLPASGAVAWCGILAAFLLHGLERYNRHVVDRAPFLEFI